MRLPTQANDTITALPLPLFLSPSLPVYMYMYVHMYICVYTDISTRYINEDFTCSTLSAYPVTIARSRRDSVIVHCILLDLSAPYRALLVPVL